MMTLLLALLALAQTAAYPPDAECQDYGDGSTLAMAECLKAQTKVWDARLNTEYRAALARHEVDPALLKRSQQAWIRYRDANCEVYYRVEGAIGTILTGNCLREMTRARTLELRDMAWTG